METSKEFYRLAVEARQDHEAQFRQNIIAIGKGVAGVTLSVVFAIGVFYAKAEYLDKKTGESSTKLIGSLDKTAQHHQFK